MRIALTTIGLAVLLVLVCAPLTGVVPLVRLPAVLVPALALVLLITRPWQGDRFARLAAWQPSTRQVWSVALIVAAFLFWYVLTRFRSGEINAIDFTVYYDRPCFQTVHGRPLFVEISDTPGLSRRSEFGDHAYWGMLAVCSLYTIHPTPLWLHAISAIAVVAGACYVLRIAQRLGAGGVLAGASALAFVLNDNTARTLNYGFHPEVFYAWLVPWMIDAGLRGARRSFLAATVACVLVKEDALLPIFAVCTALALNRFRLMGRVDRLLFLVAPPVLALGNLALYYGWVLFLVTGEGRPAYAHFWANYGGTPTQALLGMLGHPVRVLSGIMTSGVSRVLSPHLFLPLVGWRWAVGLLPIVALYGASANEQVHAFGIYYAIALVPLLVVATSSAALGLARRLTGDAARAQLASAAVVLGGALLIGASHRGYALRAWKSEVAAVPEAVARLADEPLVLVQSGLFPHVGYDERLRLLTRETLAESAHAGVAVLLSPALGAYPLGPVELHGWLSRLEPVRPMPSGILAVRLPQPTRYDARARDPAPGGDGAEAPARKRQGRRNRGGGGAAPRVRPDERR